MISLKWIVFGIGIIIFMIIIYMAKLAEKELEANKYKK